MGYPAATGRGASRTDATRARDLGGVSRRQKGVGSSSRSIGMGRSFFSARRAWRNGEMGGCGERRLSETRGGVRWPPREKKDRPRQRRFHWCAKSPTS